jgi:hypothetical protein
MFSIDDQGILHSAETSPILSPIEAPREPKFDRQFYTSKANNNNRQSFNTAASKTDAQTVHNSHSDSLSFETVMGGEDGSNSVFSGDDSTSLSSVGSSHVLGTVMMFSGDHATLNHSGERDDLSGFNASMYARDSTSDGDGHMFFSLERQGGLGRRKMVTPMFLRHDVCGGDVFR